MSKDSFYLHFNSLLCNQTNKWEYVINLPDYIECGTDYEIGLITCSYSHDKDIRFFCTNLIDPQYYHEKKLRILKVILPSTYNYRNSFTPSYVPMSGQSSKFNWFSIYILSPSGNPKSLRTQLSGTLHVRKRK